MKNSWEGILKKYWGYDGFRGIQREIIESVSSGHDTLGLMPTGGGKSITFQVPALAMEGVCIVITPLIALMNDQVAHLRSRHIRAAAIHSGLDHEDIIRILENAIFGGVKLLYVSPERLDSELFMKKLSHMAVSFICVDEAHCISQWGYDFRPSYLTIASIRKIVPNAPVLALTATATPEVVQDIQDKLQSPLNSKPQPFNVFRMSFERKNLSYMVRHAADKEEQMVHILRHIEGSAIVYTRSRMRTKEISEMLCKAGLTATFFHAGLDSAEKERRQKAWQADKVRIMVATNAFGMGIDKADVRVVLHADCPESLEAYFQEAGRAGRDGKEARAILLYNDGETRKLLKRISDTFPEKEEIRQVYDHLAYFYQIAVGSGYHAMFEFPIDKFCHTYHHYPTRVLSALQILNRAGYIEYHEEEDSRCRVKFILERDDLYRLYDHSQREDAIIVALLRNYSGLFNDYNYIDEAFIGQQTGLTLTEVYLVLKELDRKHIIDFIPQRRSPYVRYLQRREDSEHLLFPPAIYDELKLRYTARIKHVIAYATTDTECRSRMLLRYFGEQRSDDCGICDVCLCNRQQPDDVQEAMRQIRHLLADGKEHHIDQLHSINLPFDAIEKALRQLIEECQIIDDDGYLLLALSS